MCLRSYLIICICHFRRRYANNKIAKHIESLEKNFSTNSELQSFPCMSFLTEYKVSWSTKISVLSNNVSVFQLSRNPFKSLQGTLLSLPLLEITEQWLKSKISKIILNFYRLFLLAYYLCLLLLIDFNIFIYNISVNSVNICRGTYTLFRERLMVFWAI